MKKTLIPLICLAVAAAIPSASALSPTQVKWCQTKAAGFGQRQNAIKKDALERERLAEEAELAGETWENAEALRNFGEAEAAAADEAKTAYEAAKAAFYDVDQRVTANTSKLNEDVAKFNQICVE